MLALPNQTPGLIEQCGPIRAEVEREVWAIDSSGRKYSAVEAANRILKELNSSWPALQLAYFCQNLPLDFVEQMA